MLTIKIFLLPLHPLSQTYSIDKNIPVAQKSLSGLSVGDRDVM